MVFGILFKRTDHAKDSNIRKGEIVMTHAQKAEALFYEGYNCAQSVLFAFEDVTGLDRKTGAWLQEFLRKLRESGKTLVLATHNELLTEALADRILTMNEEHGID